MYAKGGGGKVPRGPTTQQLEEAMIREAAGLTIPDVPSPVFDTRTEAALGTLRPELAATARDHLFTLRQAAIDARMSYGARSMELQADMYAGRGAGFRVAPPGRSAHNYGAGYDIAIYSRGGHYISGGAHPFYQLAGQVGRSLGLVWGGLWQPNPDYSHFELAGWRNLSGLQLYTGP